jgi:hypothetical protein
MRLVPRLSSWRVWAGLVSMLVAAVFYGINWPRNDMTERFKPPVLT